jgi:hypothetical protein
MNDAFEFLDGLPAAVFVARTSLKIRHEDRPAIERPFAQAHWQGERTSVIVGCANHARVAEQLTVSIRVFCHHHDCCASVLSVCRCEAAR